MINRNDVSQEQGHIKIKVGKARIYADRIEIGRFGNWVGTVVKLLDKSGRVNAFLPIELFTEDAIEKMKSFTNTEVIEEKDIKETDREEPNTEETDIDEWSIEEVREKLKPCPFCGGKELNLIYLDEEGWQLPYYDELAEYACVKCDKCHMTMKEQILLNDDMKKLFKRWNIRVE